VGRRRLGFLIDVAVVVVLVAHAAAFVALRRHQSRDDGDARAIAAWMLERHEDRLAWPRKLRSAVPALLDAGVTPVLTDDPVAPQQLVVNDAPIVVTRAASAARDLTLEEFRTGPLIARRVDLERAARVPLRTGETVGEQIARPYVFSPLRDSRRLRDGEPMRRSLLLAPGTYAVHVEAFRPHRGGSLRLLVTEGFLPLTKKQFPFAAIVEHPFVAEFRVPAGGSQTVNVTFTAQDVAGRPAYLNRWQLVRTAGRR
jgi:hypothetical protein